MTKGADIIKVLLANRGLKTKADQIKFFNPEDPEKISLSQVGIDQKSVDQAILRIKKAKETKEKVIVYGDYDADGVCSTAILWEVLYAAKVNVLPFIPNRFLDGYGISSETVRSLKDKSADLGLIVTVDNGIVANEAVETANVLGINVIISDHHQKGQKLPKALTTIHTDQIGGAGVAWFFAREIASALKVAKFNFDPLKELELAAIGTISDQIPLLGVNRSLVKYGLVE